MPIGILVNCAAVFVGGVTGAFLKKWLPQRLKTSLPNVFGLSAILMGVTLMTKVSSLSAVVLSIILGTAIGELLRMEDALTSGLGKLEKRVPMDHNSFDTLISLVVLFCFAGTGIFGAMNSAITGDHTVLYTKAIMDFFTAIIFGTTAGAVVGLIAVPQLAVGLLLYVLAGLIMPLMTEPMMANFKAVGGLITFAVGLKILGIKKMQVLNMLPGLILVFPVSTIL